MFKVCETAQVHTTQQTHNKPKNTKTQSLLQKEVHTSQLHNAQVHTTQQTHKNTNFVPERSAYFIVHTKAIAALCQKQMFITTSPALLD